jgi:AcrR family transcriptional regulator
MFKSATAKGAETRNRILQTSLALFRERGFETTTMRDIARASGMSLGAAYHYFPSKDAIVLAYYHEVEREHHARVEKALTRGSSLDQRLAIPFHTKLDILAGDRPLLGALLRFTGQPSHPLSFLGRGTRDIQLHSMTIFAAPLREERLADDVRSLAPVALWALHMGILLFFLYDQSPNQQRTRRLVDRSVPLFVWMLKATKLPGLRALPAKVLGVLTEAGLVPHRDELAAATLATAALGPNLEMDA